MKLSTPGFSQLSFLGESVWDTGTGSTGSSNTAGTIERNNKEIINVPTHIVSASSAKNWVNQLTTNLAKNLTEKDEEVLLIMPAGQQIDNEGKQVFVAPNIKIDKGNDKGKPIGPVFVEDIKSALIQKGVDLRKLDVLNDGALHGVNAAIKLAQISPEYFTHPKNEGNIVAVAFPGGGFGGMHFEIQKDKVNVIPEETGHYLTPSNMVNKKYLLEDQISRKDRIALEEYSVSAPAAIRIFAKSLGFDDAITKKLMNLKEGRVLTQHEITLDSKDSEQKKQIAALRNSKLFKEMSGEGENVKFMLLKGDRPITKDEQVKALKAAGTEFFKGIGVFFGKYEATNRCDTVMITTKFANSMKNALENIGVPAEKIVQDAAWNNLDDPRRSAILSPENQKVIIHNTQDPCTIENAKAILKGSTQGKFKVIEIPKSIILNP